MLIFSITVVVGEIVVSYHHVFVDIHLWVIFAGVIFLWMTDPLKFESKRLTNHWYQ